MRQRFGLALLFIGFAAGARGADPATAPKKTPTPAANAPSGQACTAPEFHQFDFWLGDWNVTAPEGKPLGTSKVSAILGGCAIQENWTSATGGKATSISVYDAPNRRWHQTWVDDTGGLLQLDGEFRDGVMVLIGRRPSVRDRGSAVVHRIAWTVTSPDHVLQRWEVSKNEGRTWSTFFEGTYVRRK